MWKSKIPILNRLDTISHVMPYFAYTHIAFLLLSSLCSTTRSKLDEFYDEFVFKMGENWRLIKSNSVDQLDHLFLPSDLFEVSIWWIDQKSICTFIKFILNLRDSKGWYFNSHYMHSKIKIQGPIKVDIRIIKRLYTYVDVLKSTQVILCKRDTYSSKIEYELTTLDTNSTIDCIFKKTYINVHYACNFMFGEYSNKLNI